MYLTPFVLRLLIMSFSFLLGWVERWVFCHDKTRYYSTIAPFYHIRVKERPKYANLLHFRTGQKYELMSDKMAAPQSWNNKSLIRWFSIFYIIFFLACERAEFSKSCNLIGSGSGRKFSILPAHGAIPPG